MEQYKQINSAKVLSRFVPCDVKSYVTLFTAIGVNHLYHQMTLGLWIK